MGAYLTHVPFPISNKVIQRRSDTALLVNLFQANLIQHNEGKPPASACRGEKSHFPLDRQPSHRNFIERKKAQFP